MRFRHEKARKTTAKRTVSFLLMLCLLLPMIPSSMGLEAKADDDDTTTSSNTVTIKLHDLYIDRKEALPDGTNLGTSKDNPNACLDAYKKARSITVEKGTTLEEAFEKFKGDKNLQLGTKSLKDTGVYKLGTEDDKAMTSEINASECVWYTRDGENGGVDGNNPREKFDATTKITGDVDLYTYSYRLRLVTGEQTYKDLIVREGQTSGFIYGSDEGRNKTYAISEFLSQNSVDETWTDVNLGTKLTNTTQFNNGITQNYTLRANGVNARTQEVDCKVAVNGSWVSAGTISLDLDRVDVWGKTGPALNYYVTDDELKKVYGTYGFGTAVKFTEEDKISSTVNGYFPFYRTAESQLRIRQMPKHETIGENQTQFRVPLVEETGDTAGLAVYYTPHNTTEYDSNFLSYDGNTKENGRDRYGWASPNDSAVLRDNSFYTVSVDDADKTQFDNSTTLPNKDEYHLYGSKVKFTLPLTNTSGNTVKWYVEKGGDNVTIDEKTGKVTVTAIDKQLVLTTDASKEYADDVQVHCFVLVNGEPKEIGKLHTHAIQTYEKWGNESKTKTRYYVTAEQAETVFGEFGFKASEFDPDTKDSQKYIFANTTYDKTKQTSNATIWMDAVPTKFDGIYKIPLAKRTEFDNNQSGSKDLSLYYVPNNNDNEKYTQSVDVTKSTMFQEKNSFYSVEIEDPDGLLGEDVILPKTKYYLSGKSVSFKLPYKEDVTWTCLNTTDGLAISNKYPNHIGQYIPITIDSIDHPITYTTQTVTNEVTVHCYIFVNKEKLEVATAYFKKDSHIAANTGSNNWEGNRYYITASALGSIYGDYGFDVSSYQPNDTKAAEDPQNLYFPTAVHESSNQWDEYNNPDTLWADAYPHDYKDNQGYKIPLTKTSLKQYNIDLYYAPGNNNSYLGKAKFSKNNISNGAIFIGMHKNEANREVNTAFIEANTFYPITFEDPEGNFLADDIPNTQYALSGTDKTITLPYDENVNWYIDSDGSTTKISPISISEDKKTATYTLQNVTKSMKLTTDGVADDEVAVAGYISLNGKWEKISSMKIPTSQATGTNKDDRYYLTSKDLEKLFGSCGFQAENYKDTSADNLSKYFPSSTIQIPDGDGAEANYAKIWTNAKGTKNSDGTWQVNTIQLKNKSKGIAVYYVPNTTHVTGSSFAKTNADVLKDNQFYAISFEDSTKTLDSNKIPSTMYRRAGQVKVTLPYAEGITWTAMGKVNIAGSDVSSAATTIQEVNADKTEVQLTITVNASLTVTTDTSVDKNQINLVSYVAIDGEWKQVDTSLTTLSKLNWDSTIENGDRNAGRFYITAEELETIYGQYGFRASDCTVSDNNTRLFAVRTEYKQELNNGSVQGSDSKIWADQLPKASGSSWYLPLIESGYVQKEQLKDNVVYLYYLPKNTSGKTEYFKDSCANTKQEMINANSFYSIQVKDTGSNFNSSELPKDQLLLSGTGTTIELPYKDGVTWKVTDKDGALVQLEQEKTADGKVKITVPSISYPLIVTTEEAASVNLSDKDVAVNAYVSIDDTWVPVRTEWQYTDGKFVGGSDSFFIEKLQTTKDSRYYLTVAQLEELFGKQYDFSANSFTTSSKNCFPHSTIRYKDSSSNSIYGDTEPVQINGTWCIPFINTGDKDLGISIYYTPKTTGTTKSWLKTDSKLLSDNCFSYSMSAADPLGLGGDMTLPQAKYFDKGTSATFTVPKAPDDAKWVAIDKNTGVTISDTNLKLETNNKDGSITYSIDKITQPIQFILTDGQVIVQYTANLEYSDREPLGNLFREVSKQKIIEDGTVQQKATYADTVTDSGTYTVRSPDSDRVKVRATESFGSGKRAEPRDYYYTFKGWQVEGTNNIIEPGKSLTKELGEDLAVVKLHAKWEALDDQKRPNTVNFYLSTACEIMDNMSNGFAGQAKSAFTTTIYSTRIYGTDRLTIDSSQTADNGDFQILAPADTASTAYRTDTTLRNSVNTAFTSAAITSNNKLLLESFPTDEEILESLKERIKNGDEGVKTTVTMDGQEISADELTTTNFAVRWYVLKYHNSDAWHIDGVLVAKQARAVVTKTFAGDEDAIEAVKKSGYSISVTHNHKQGEDDHTDYILSLNPDYQELRQGYVGYTRYDEDTDTYTWVLTARQNREYTLTEHNYKPPDSTDESSVKYDGTYHYMIENSEGDDNTTDWQTYPEKTGIKLTAQAYPEDAPEDSYQRVSFRNIYVRDGLLTVMKADAATGRGLGKVQFRISRVDGATINVYRKYTMNGEDKVYQNQYAVRKADEDSVSGGEKDADNLYEQVDNNILETDGTGLFQVYLPVDSTSRSAEYYLEETLPLGYDGPTKLKVTVSDNGKIQQITKVVEPTEALPDGKKWITGENTAILTINNYSKILTTVTAQKQWDNTVSTDERKSVKVELWRNGVKMTDTANTLYTQTLNADNNWSYTWNNLPLFVDGEIADYQLREVQINDTKYDLEAGSNGYKDYVVSYDATKYLQHLEGEDDLKTLDPLSKTNLAKWNSDEASTTPYWGEDSNRTYAKHALLVVRNSKKPADILFTKTDGLGSPLQGALFGMYSDAECKHLLSQSKSDANGQVQFVSRAGEMYIKEISAPEGCTLDETVYQVVTENDKKVLKKVSDTDDISSTVDTIANLSHINLLIQKVDNNGNALTGAKFKIEKLDTTTNTYEPFGQGTYTVKNTDGIVQITDDNGARLDFDEGKYRITETETPGKLYRNAGSIIVTVQGGQVYYEKAESDTDIDSWKMEQRENTVIYTLQVVNTPWYALPSTGGGNSYAALAVALGAAIMCGAAALAFWLRKRRSSEENNPNINT